MVRRSTITLNVVHTDHDIHLKVSTFC